MSLAHEPVPSDNTAVPDRHSLSVLIVDDELDLLTLLRDILQEAGFGVLTAGDGRAALALLEHTLVAVVLTDLMMPTMTGLQLGAL
jgi:CheY-like chemotaxis protein